MVVVVVFDGDGDGDGSVGERLGGGSPQRSGGHL